MNIIQMLVPDNIVFPGFWDNTPRWLILHKTAGFHTAQDVAAYFQNGSDGREVSSHYVIGLDGTVVQCVRETDGAGANGVLEDGHDPWWSGNPNLVTYSIEHVDPTPDNSTPVPDAQKQVSFQLIHDICTRHNIPMRPADADGGITGHYSIDPQSRAHCPGNYPWDELWAYLKGAQHMPVPQGWSDNGTTLVSPNGHKAVKGFRQHILDAENWDQNDQLLEEEQQVPQVELHTSRGAGARQLTVGHMLVWTQEMGVKESACGAEIQACYNKLAAYEKQIAGLQSQLKQPVAGINLTNAQASLRIIAQATTACQTALGGKP